jgi:branched-chain amino acid transport system ATP-binding protein
VRPITGEVLFENRPIARLSPGQIFQAGIARTFQQPELIATQSVHANALVGAHFAHDTSLADTLSYSERSYDSAAVALVDFGLVEAREQVAGSASLYQRKIIMLASAMAHTPRVLLLDEPVAGLSDREADAIMAFVSRILKRGTTVVIIEHVMRVLMAVSDRFVLLNRGRLFFDGRPEEARENPDVQQLYFGTVHRGASG